MERLLRIREVASITGEDNMTIYRRIRGGELKAIRVGQRGVRVAESELRRWLRICDQTQAHLKRGA
jgi:excisionase family DNA binding protein